MNLTLKKTLTYSMLMTLGACLILSDHRLSADEKPEHKASNANPESSITVNNCRIKLIDRVILGSDRPGVLEFVEPNEGELVKKGQVIAALKSDALQAAKATAKKKATNDIEIRYSQKARDTAYVELEMNLDINKRVRNTISKLDIKRLTLNAEKSDLQIEQAQLEFEMNKLQLNEIDAQIEETKIIAPFDGIVTKKFRSTGEVVRHGDEVLELVSTKRVKVESYVNIEDTWMFQVGTPVQVQLDIPGVRLPIEEKTYTGKIIFIDVEVEPIHGKSIRVWAEVENRDNDLKAGYMATMKILTDKSDSKVAQKTEVK
ncbi:efflux RND transporter periplasmic adaptor subunit [Gimesia maris]|uniref:Efflux pump membrane fusion protein n=1 Tax=Gimesia maris TaxID=122 RepID=A0ABX5YPD9_9PLAN|nr:efflux RND transporter periplasmic adaptor subunit [Gimesia maris]QDU15599.1 putative efflux pump membrane fusion protein [Gimesia maris]QEG17626.1 putative efflux pump membrane fusion protein [Gimesia maris]QGQ29319.1 efflux RND transporter periplasmic adaptor subunit [Gimesia maris]